MCAYVLCNALLSNRYFLFGVVSFLWFDFFFWFFSQLGLFLDFFSLDDLDFRECFLDLCDLVLELEELCRFNFLLGERLDLSARIELTTDELRLVALHECLECRSS